MEPSFEVVMIKQRHGKQATLPNIIQSVSNDDLPPLVTISSKQKTDQVYQKIIFCFIHACFIKYIFANYVLAAAIIIIHSSIHRYTWYGCGPAIWVSIFLLFRSKTYSSTSNNISNNYSAWDTTEKHEEQNWKKLKNEEWSNVSYPYIIHILQRI